MAIDWTASMQQTFEFYIVDPATWGDKELFTQALRCTINRDLESDLLVSATIDTTALIDESYIRIYLVATQGRETEKVPLATVLVQTPSIRYTGKAPTISMDAYSPLIELRDKYPLYGYAAAKTANTMYIAGSLAQENMRAPVVLAKSDETLTDTFISDFMNDNFLSYLRDMAATAKFEFALDERGRVLFNPVKKISSLQPVWEFNDGNSSILHPELTLNQDFYGIPNVVEVLYSTSTGYKFSRVENNDLSHPLSIPNRGRLVVHRVTNPSSLINPTQEQTDVYAENLLDSMSTLEYKVTYTHGYCPVNIGDCVLLNYENANLSNVKAMVTSQSIECRPGCQVTETAFFTQKFWR